MPELILPGPRVQRSFLTAVKEFQAEGRGGPDDNSQLGREIFRWPDRWDDPAEFAAYVTWLRADAAEESRRPPGHVPSTSMWGVEGEEYLGRLTIRHRLTPSLLTVGGHIGYDVRPSARRRGHATAMLALALPVASGMGIDGQRRGARGHARGEAPVLGPQWLRPGDPLNGEAAADRGSAAAFRVAHGFGVGDPVA
jgi:predicted acetyltransferase